MNIDFISNNIINIVCVIQSIAIYRLYYSLHKLKYMIDKLGYNSDNIVKYIILNEKRFKTKIDIEKVKV